METECNPGVLLQSHCTLQAGCWVTAVSLAISGLPEGFLLSCITQRLHESFMQDAEECTGRKDEGQSFPFILSTCQAAQVFCM